MAYGREAALAGVVPLFVIAALAMGGEAYAGFYAPVVDGELKAGSNLTIYVSNDTVVSSPQLLFSQIGSPSWTLCPLSFFAQSEMNCSISSEKTSEQAVYEFYFNSTETRFPEGNATIRIALSKRFGNYSVLGDAFGLNSSEDAYGCNPWTGNYSCGYETYQAEMIEGYWAASRATGNATYESIAYNFTLGDYEQSLGFYGTCDHSKGDFDCENVNLNDPNITLIPRGSLRQASLISSLWSAVQYGANSTVRELALNYTRGHAEDCDVWSGVFNCTYADSQGLMMSAYSKAYEMTGNQTFLDIAKNLSEFGILMNDSSRLASGVWDAYEMTGNETYLAKAEELSGIERGRCVGGICNAIELSENTRALLNAYRMNGGYQRYAYARIHAQENATDCGDALQDYSCQTPRGQGAMISRYYLAYLYLPDKNSSFFMPRIFPAPQAAANISIAVQMQGPLTSPGIYFRRTNTSEWQTCWMSFFNDQCTIGALNVSAQASYEYYFNSSETRFPPENGTLKFAASAGNDTYFEKAENITVVDPAAPSKCNAWGETPDYACDDERAQAIMIDAFWTAQFVSGNTTYLEKAYMFSLGNYSALPAPDCDHSKEDFNCSTSEIQASLISSLWSAVQYGANSTVRELALNYTRGHAEDCDVWSGVFNCTYADSQGLMMSAYSKAYEMTGNQTFLDIAKNLSEFGILMNDSSRLASGVWDAYGMTGNETYGAKAQNLTNAYEITRCLGAACGAPGLSANVNALLDAYRATGNYSYSNYSELAVLSGPNPSSGCNAWADSYSCLGSEDQGAMISIFWSTYQALPASVKGNITLSATKDTLDVDERFNATCSVENAIAGGASLLDVNITLSVSGGLEVIGNASALFSEILPAEIKNNTWELRATSGGAATIGCNATTGNGWTGYAEKAVSVNTVASQPSGGGYVSYTPVNVTVEPVVEYVPQNITVTNETVPVNDTAPPKISVISPQDGTVLFSPNTTVLFDYEDENDVNCTAGIGTALVPVKKMPGEYARFNATGMENGTHELVIICSDAYGNSAESRTVFYVDLGDKGMEGMCRLLSPQLDWLYLLLILIETAALAFRKQIFECLFAGIHKKQIDILFGRAEELMGKGDYASFLKLYPKLCKKYMRYCQNSNGRAFRSEMKFYMFLKMSKKNLSSLDKMRAEKMFNAITRSYHDFMLASKDEVMKSKITAAYNLLAKDSQFSNLQRSP